MPQPFPLLSILNSSPFISAVSADKNIIFLCLLGFIFTYIVIIGGEATQNCDMDNRQRRQPPASNGEAISDARAEEITPSVPVRRSMRRRGDILTPGCSMDNQQLQQPPVSNGEAIRDARAEESTPSVAGVRRRNHSAPVRRSTRRRGG